MISLENIKRIELKSLVGYYKITLFSAEDFGDELYFKPSLLYPLNFKRKDDLVHLLRKNVERAKQRVVIPPTLPSQAQSN